MFELTDEDVFQITVHVPGEAMKRTLTVTEVIVHGMGDEKQIIRKAQAMKPNAMQGGSLKAKLHS